MAMGDPEIALDVDVILLRRPGHAVGAAEALVDKQELSLGRQSAKFAGLAPGGPVLLEIAAGNKGRHSRKRFLSLTSFTKTI
jgi:hypothetical protein